MVDKLSAVLAIAIFATFLMIVTSFVNELALWIVTLLVLAMGIYDFLLSFRNGSDSGNSGSV